MLTSKNETDMKKLIVGLMVGLGILLLDACQSKTSRIDDLRNFVEQLSEDCEDYTAEQWEKANDEFSQLLDKINSYDDLTKEELEEVARLQGQYAATVFKNSGKAVMEEIEKAGVALDGFLNSLNEGLENEDK